MRRAALVVATVLLLLIAALLNHGGDTEAAQRPRPAGTTFSGKAFRFNKVKDGVYHAVGTGALTVVGNSTVLVNDRDVIVVDDHVSPAAAWVLLEEIKSITDKPVTTVVNTHFHFDHAHGNQIHYFQAYLRDAWTAVSALKKQGVPAAEAAKRADMSKHKERFPNPNVPAIAAERIYALIDGAR